MADPAGRATEDGRLSAPDQASLAALAARLQAVALEHDLRVATAESCTGGLLGHSITANAGSSGWYVGGVISYANHVKSGVLGVAQSSLEHHGAVSAQVAIAMAEGARQLLGADFALAVTGVAGPDGGTAAKPVGLTYVAVAGPDGDEARRYQWQGDRTANKARSAAAAMTLLLEVLGSPGPDPA